MSMGKKNGIMPLLKLEKFLKKQRTGIHCNNQYIQSDVESIEILKEKCPSYDNSIPRNQIAKLETAFRYAIASNGETFTWRTAPEEKLKEIFDVRGFVLTIDPKNSKQAIADRYRDIRQRNLYRIGVIELCKREWLKNF